MANYCGKSCEGCTYQEQLQCPGCAKGPGRTYGGDCEVASCCFSRKHDTCETCTGKNLCGKYRGRDKIPQWRIERQEQKAAQWAYLAKKAPWCYRWFAVMFWVMIVNTAIDFVKTILSGISIVATVTEGLMVAGTILYGVGLLMLSREEEEYRKAGICRLIGIIPITLSLFMQQEMPFLTIIASIVAFVGVFFEFKCHSDILADVDNELSEKWQALLKWKFAVLAATIGMVLFAWLPLVNVLMIFFSLVGTLVVEIINIVYLHHTMRAFRDFV